MDGCTFEKRKALYLSGAYGGFKSQKKAKKIRQAAPHQTSMSHPGLILQGMGWSTKYPMGEVGWEWDEGDQC